MTYPRTYPCLCPCPCAFRIPNKPYNFKPKSKKKEQSFNFIRLHPKQEVEPLITPPQSLTLDTRWREKNRIRNGAETGTQEGEGGAGTESAPPVTLGPLTLGPPVPTAAVEMAPATAFALGTPPAVSTAVGVGRPEVSQSNVSLPRAAKFTERFDVVGFGEEVGSGVAVLDAGDSASSISVATSGLVPDSLSTLYAAGLVGCFELSADGDANLLVGEGYGSCDGNTAVDQMVDGEENAESRNRDGGVPLNEDENGGGNDSLYPYLMAIGYGFIDNPHPEDSEA